MSNTVNSTAFGEMAGESVLERYLRTELNSELLQLEFAIIMIFAMAREVYRQKLYSRKIMLFYCGVAVLCATVIFCFAHLYLILDTFMASIELMLAKLKVRLAARTVLSFSIGLALLLFVGTQLASLSGRCLVYLFTRRQRYAPNNEGTAESNRPQSNETRVNMQEILDLQNQIRALRTPRTQPRCCCRAVRYQRRTLRPGFEPPPPYQECAEGSVTIV